MSLVLPTLVPYASGLSRIPDFRAAAWAGHGVGVVATELSRAAITALGDVLATYATPLFADSGAYGAFRAGRLGALDFGKVLGRYDAVMQAIADSNPAEEALPAPLFVMPDAPGDQAQSLTLLRTHRRYIETLLAFPGLGRPVIAMHEGPIPLGRLYRQLIDWLGRDDFIVGLPSAAAALSDAGAADLLRNGRPRHLHILGAVSHTRLRPRIAQVVEADLALTTLSADANLLRSRVLRPGRGPGTRVELIAAEMGRAARAAELGAFTERLGGWQGLQAAFTGADADGRKRLVGLVADLSGVTTEAALSQLSQPSPALAIAA